MILSGKCMIMEYKRFEFGKNWLSFVMDISDEDINKAKSNILLWLENEDLSKKTILDIGCGSGLHSYAFFQLGSKKIISFDFDNKSVEATKILWEKAGKPSNWEIFQGSVLDDEWLSNLGEFDIIYSWGVLHHTGNMWKSIKNVLDYSVHDKSKIWLALYQGVNTYKSDFELKIKYNKSNFFGKKLMVLNAILKIMKKRRAKGENPFTWNVKRGRGMNTYHDLVDWMGGFPYEVCSKDELAAFMKKNGGGDLIKYNDDESCIVYVFDKNSKNIESVFQIDQY